MHGGASSKSTIADVISLETEVVIILADTPVAQSMRERMLCASHSLHIADDQNHSAPHQNNLKHWYACLT